MKIIIFILFLFAIALSACVHTTEVGFLVIKNETGQLLEGKTRFAGESELGDDFTIEPEHDAVLEKYDIAPGTQIKVLDSFAEMKLKQNDCVLILTNDQIRKNSSFEGVSVLIHINPKLFANCTN